MVYMGRAAIRQHLLSLKRINKVRLQRRERQAANPPVLDRAASFPHNSRIFERLQIADQVASDKSGDASNTGCERESYRNVHTCPIILRLLAE